jgi:putative ABC transport system ATP-binding protein
MINIEALEVSFHQGGGEDRKVLNGIDLRVPKGQTVSIIGSNGAGKSTLLNAIAGTVPISSGSIVLDGRDCGKDPEWRRAAYLGRVRQNPLAGTAGEMTILDNLALAARKGPRGLRIAVNKSKAKVLAEQVSQLDMGLENRLRGNVSRLSGGQRQALTLLMAVLSHPSVLLLDEHTAALDPGNAEIVGRLTRRFIAEYGLTALIVTHDMKQALEQADRVVMMHEGRILADVSGGLKERMGVAALVELFRPSRGKDYAEDRDLLG